MKKRGGVALPFFVKSDKMKKIFSKKLGLIDDTPENRKIVELEKPKKNDNPTTKSKKKSNPAVGGDEDGNDAEQLADGSDK